MEESAVTSEEVVSRSEDPVASGEELASGEKSAKSKSPRARRKSEELLDVKSGTKEAKADGEKKLSLSHGEVGAIAEAVELMASSTPVKKEREEIASLESGREKKREVIEEGKKASRSIRMLDKRVDNMISNLRLELEQTESTIGDALQSLDLDNDGILSRDELIKAVDDLHVTRRPDAAAFMELLDEIDTDKDGMINVADFQRLVKEMKSRGDDRDDEDDTPSAPPPPPQQQQPSADDAESGAPPRPEEKRTTEGQQ